MDLKSNMHMGHHVHVSGHVCIQMSPIAGLTNLQQLSQKGTGMLVWVVKVMQTSSMLKFTEVDRMGEMMQCRLEVIFKV